MGQSSRIQTSKNSVITKTLYNNSLYHTNPQQNGHSERFKRTIINAAKAILKEDKLNGPILGKMQTVL